MTPKTLKIWIVLGLATGGLILGAGMYHHEKQTPMADQKSKALSRDMAAGETSQPIENNDHQKTVKSDKGPTAQGAADFNSSFVDQAVESLRAEFLDKIDMKSSQASLIRLRQYLMETYPDSWKQLFTEIITKAFPEHAESIFSTLALLDTYNLWLEANKPKLANLDHDDIKAALWAKRRELFGLDANELWAEETRTEAIIDVLDILRDAYDTGLDEKLSIYAHAIGETYEDDTDPFLQNKKFYLSRAFLRMDSVQENLKAMDADTRSQSIRDVRIAMGYSEEDSKKLAHSDAENEKRWQQGYLYMDERAKILAAFQGVELKDKLSALQDTYFSYQAKTIQAEEASGFFRFERPRVYGCN
ncbi:MAG: hypothetical protein KKD44_15395 [Proteobacteria bacterium]|nr:hypothetical protein [Pseudomonadota bacterium]